MRQDHLDINSKDERTGMTALHYACLRGDSPELVQMLLAKGADPSLQDNCNNTPLDLTYFSYSLVQQVIALATNINLSWPNPYILQEKLPTENHSHMENLLSSYYCPPICSWGTLTSYTATIPSEERREKNISQIRQILAEAVPSANA